MFYCIATKALKDGTQGFRFNVCGVKGLTRKRLFKRRWGIAKGKSMVSLHIGKRSVYIERKTNKTKGKISFSGCDVVWSKFIFEEVLNNL